MKGLQKAASSHLSEETKESNADIVNNPHHALRHLLLFQEQISERQLQMRLNSENQVTSFIFDC